MLAKVTVSQGLKSLRNESGWGIPWRSSGRTPRSLPRALVQFLVEELRSHKPFSTAKGKPKKRWPSLDNCSKEPPIIESDDSF